jgi:UbiD family decarboxylase
MRFKSLDEFVDCVDKAGDVVRFSGADQELEIGVLSEILAEQSGPLTLFDELEGVVEGGRVAANVINAPRRFAMAMGMDPGLHPIEMVKQWRALRPVPIPPVTVDSGRVTEVVTHDVDLSVLPMPKWHEHDGGSYIGTGDVVVIKDPDSGWVNLGTYRCCVQGPSDVSLWIVAAKHGRILAEKYWARGEDCPVAIVLGSDPITFFAANSGVPQNKSEYDHAGALHGAPVEVLRTPVHNLPVPAHAEIVLEGRLVDPAKETVSEGPFGEWPGYYAHKGQETVVHLDTMLRAHRPILYGAPPFRPLGHSKGIPSFAGALWDHLERSGISDVVGVWGFNHTLMTVVSLRPRYTGHAKQALLAMAGFRMYGSMANYHVAVDEDIDPTNLQEVMWAMCTRVDATRDVDIIDGTWTSGLDPRLSPAQRASGELTMGRMLVDATKPFAWRDEFPQTNRFRPDQRRAAAEKWRGTLEGLSLDWSKF